MVGAIVRLAYLRISTIKIDIMRSRFVIGQLGCSNNPLCMISC